MDFLSSGFNVVLIILGFGLLIFIHELGHFIAAKWAGIRTEAFAIGMGPVLLAWRKGLGLRVGSTSREYQKRVQGFLASDDAHRGATPDAAETTTELPPAEMYRIGDKLGLGETEYSLRILPIGGFVKMLGQEDANPNYVSNDPRSYTQCPVGKRMIVVSAGVIMNLVLAVILFIIAFMIGVRFEAPVVGHVSSMLPAGRTMPENAQALGIRDPGLQPGDRVDFIDGEPARTFADLQIASAMSKPGSTVTLSVTRADIDRPLDFRLRPEKDPATGLLSIGVSPGESTTLWEVDEDGLLARMLKKSDLDQVGIKPGMRILSVNGQEVTAYGQLDRFANQSDGKPLDAVWSAIDNDGHPSGVPLAASIPTSPEYTEYLQRDKAGGDMGLLGFSPLTRFAGVLPGSPNQGKLQAGDVLIGIGDVHYPRRSQLFEVLQAHKRKIVPITVLRNGREQLEMCAVNRDGQVLAEIEFADDVLVSAQPVTTYAKYRPDTPAKTEELQSPIAVAKPEAPGGMKILAVNEHTVDSWPAFRELLRQATARANTANQAIALRVTVSASSSSPPEEVLLELSAADVKQLHSLGWNVDLPSFVFQPIYTIRSSGGNPLTAIAMGFEETKKLILMTYLTIDRLIRRSVGVDQLRGPVGIVHLGSKIVDRGFTYLIFFLAMISVNLAVINFLPMPIVDGGLFLFLIYEKLKGKPPPLAFQNAATVVGLCLIITMFVVVTWNDVVRLFG